MVDERCIPDLYHYNGLCFNKRRVPDGRIAMPVPDCEALDVREEPVSTIISNCKKRSR